MAVFRIFQKTDVDAFLIDFTRTMGEDKSFKYFF